MAERWLTLSVRCSLPSPNKTRLPNQTQQRLHHCTPSWLLSSSLISLSLPLLPLSTFSSFSSPPPHLARQSSTCDHDQAGPPASPGLSLRLSPNQVPSEALPPVRDPLPVWLCSCRSCSSTRFALRLSILSATVFLSSAGSDSKKRSSSQCQSRRPVEVLVSLSRVNSPVLATTFDISNPPATVDVIRDLGGEHRDWVYIKSFFAAEQASPIEHTSVQL